MKEHRLIITKDGEKYVEGYFFTVKELRDLLNDYSLANSSSMKKCTNVKKYIEDYEKQMQRAEKMIEKSGGGILVITEGVFGMDGEQGIIKEIVATKQKYQFRLLIDDAHGFGYMGPTGAGADEAQGCQAGVDLYFSTFVKSM